MAGPRGPSHLDHVGIAVRSIADALRFYEALGLRLEGEEEVAGQAVRVAFLPLGSTRLELLEPSSPESPIARHLDRRGPGLHHLCVSVPDIRAAMAQLADAGFELLSDEPQPGAHGCQVCFVPPKSAGGVLIELSQPPPDRR
jgi:methylmalonyl-CoA epimerase